MRRALCAAVLIIAVPGIVAAVITFEQLDGNTFTVSHRVKAFGLRGKAMRVVYEKAASLCIAAGYSQMKVVDEESHAGGAFQAPNATLTVKFYQEPAEDRIACKPKATEKYITQAKKKLLKRGYKGPVVKESSVDPKETENRCTVEQITAMVKAGMTEAQIKAACEAGD